MSSSSAFGLTLLVMATAVSIDCCWAQTTTSDAAPGWGGGPRACDSKSRCDKLTGCIPPSPPPGTMVKILPRSDPFERYVHELQAFQACRKSVLRTRKQQWGSIKLIGVNSASFDLILFANMLRRWNGDIFWKPASKGDNVITRFGDEARAVFGPIPDGDCDGPLAKTIPLQVEGAIVDLQPNLEKGGRLEFQHKDIAGNIVGWTESIPRCDKPSLAGSVSFCGLNSRLNRLVNGNVEWLFLCRKSSDDLEVRNDPYWQQSDRRFAVFGTIGYNRSSGEIVFFDGRKDQKVFDWSNVFIPPGGRSYSDTAGRTAAAALYDPTFQIPCFACHDNKNAYVVDPHAEQARVGYFSGKNDPRAIAFSLGNYLPERPRLENAPFRVIGSGYTATYGFELSTAKTVRDPTGNCTSCHTLTTLGAGRRLAPDAVDKEPWTSDGRFAQIIALGEEKTKFHAFKAHRTDWALRSGSGKIHPWMAPVHGNDISSLPPEISSSDWRRLSDCLWGSGGADCGYAPLYTSCPAPKSKPGDPSEPREITVQVLSAPSGEASGGRLIRVSWRYLNDLGGVPERDDVRFNIAVKEISIPSGGAPPAKGEYPSMEEATASNLEPLDEEIGVSGSVTVIKNASFAGHAKWTDPPAAHSPRQYEINLPGKCNRRYLARILPKRFCFDQSNVTYSAKDYLLYADVLCN